MLALGQELTTEQRITKQYARIMATEEFLALCGILMIGEWEVCDDVSTACTNGLDIKYGRGFIDSLTDAEVRFVILHEAFHKMFRHLIIWAHLNKKNPRLANIACDFNINGVISDICKAILKRTGQIFATMPEGALYDERFREGDDWMNSGKIFSILEQELEGGDGGDGGDGDDGDGDSNAGGGNAYGSPYGSTTGGDQLQPLDEHDWDGAEELTKDEQEELTRQVDEAIRQGALVAGKAFGGGNRLFEELLTPQINWREVLQEFIQSTCKGRDFSTWKRPSRRHLAAGVYMPTSISERVDELVIAVDTSGSIGQSTLTAFLSEVKGICDTVKPEKVRLLYWGTRVEREESYDQTNIDSLIKSTKPLHGGGTDAACVPQHMKEHDIKPQAAVILTDGYVFGDWGTWDCPTLWCIIDNKNARPTVGKTVHIKEQNL